MAGATAERVAAPSLYAWLQPDVLLAFVDELREAEFNIGVAQYVAAQDLVLALLAQDEPLQDPNRLKTLLGPILCGSPSEQTDFGARFDAWVERMGFEAVRGDVSDTAVSLDQELTELERKSQRWVWVAVIGIGFLLFVGLILLGPQLGSAVGTPSSGIEVPNVQLPTGILAQFVGVVLIVVAVVYVGWRLWWRNRARLFLERHAVTQEPQIEKVSVAGMHENLFPNVLFFRLAQQFRRRVEVPSTRLNVRATVAATVAEGGWFTPVYGRTQIPPEYLILIDRATFGDHQAKLVEAMIARLGQNEVFLSRYYFDGDPRLCFPEDSTRPRTLRGIMAQHSGHRLLLFTDAARFFNPRTGEIEQWTEAFEFWPERAILTPENAMQWGYTERELGRHFMVLPATVDGLSAYIGMLQEAEAGTLVGVDGQSPYPLMLRRHPQRWLERAAPDVDVLEEMFTAVRQYLGVNGYYWLSACAIYPELHWNLTLYLGQTLLDDQERPLLTAERMAALARLPWFRYSYLPDWLRTELIMRMERTQEQQVRSVLQSLLVTAVQGEMDSFQLEIAQEHGRSINALARPLVQLLARSAPEDAPVKDYVFLSFMSGRKPKPLSVRIPETFGRLLGAKAKDEAAQFKPSRWVWVNFVGAMAAAIIVLLLRQYLFFDYHHDDLFNIYLLPVIQGISWGLCLGWLQARYLAQHNLIGQMRGNWFRWILAGWFVGTVVSSLLKTVLSNLSVLNDVGRGMVAGALLGTVVGFTGWLVLRKRYADLSRYHNPQAWVTVSLLAFTIFKGISGFGILFNDNYLSTDIELYLPLLDALIYAFVVGVCTSGAFVFIRNEFGDEVINRLRARQLNQERFWLRWVGINVLAFLVAYGVGQLFALVLLLPLSNILLISGVVLGGFAGVAQGRLLRPYNISRRNWFIATLIGSLFAFYLMDATWLYGSWLLEGVVVGLLVGFAQWVVLRRYLRFAGYWVAASMIAWALGHNFAEGALLFLPEGFIATIVGGLIISVCYGFTSFVMQWLLENPKSVLATQDTDESALRRLDRWINGILVQKSLQPTWQLWLKWLVVTVVALGIGCGLGLLTASLMLTLIAGNVAHVAFDDVLFWIGFSIAGLITGLILGYAQWRYVLRPRLPRAWIWTLANGLAWAIGFGTTISTMVATTGTLNTTSVNLYLFFGGYVGLALGIGQWVVLRRAYTRRRLWLLIPATAVSWVISWLAGYIIASIFFSSIDASFYSFAFLAIITAIIYGATSGLILLWLEGWDWRSLPRWIQACTSPDVRPNLNNTFVVMWTVLSVLGLGTAVFVIASILFILGYIPILGDSLQAFSTSTAGLVIFLSIILLFSWLGLGFVQRLMLRQYRSGWLWVTTAGGALSSFLFLSWAFWLLPNQGANYPVTVGFMVWGGLIGFLVGGMQTVVLRKSVNKYGSWFFANILLWPVYGALIGYIADVTQRSYSSPVLAAFFLLFVLLLVALGLVMRWLLQYPRIAPVDQSLRTEILESARIWRWWLKARTYPDAPPLLDTAFVVLWTVMSIFSVGISIGVIFILGVLSFSDILYNFIGNHDVATWILYTIYCLIASFDAGLCQRFVLGQYRGGWLRATTIGGTVAGFIFWSLFGFTFLGDYFSRPVAFAIWGGLIGFIMGNLQGEVLRNHVFRWGYWVAVNILLWAGSVGLMGYLLYYTSSSSVQADVVFIPFGVAPTGIILFAGLGMVLRWVLQYPKPVINEPVAMSKTAVSKQDHLTKK